MPCRNPCGLYIHLAFTYSDGPRSVVCSELALTPPFPPMRVLEVQWSQALCLMCEVVLRVGLQWGPRPKKLPKGVIPFIGQEQAFGPKEFIVGSRFKALGKIEVLLMWHHFLPSINGTFFYFKKPILVLNSQSEIHRGWLNPTFLDLGS